MNIKQRGFTLLLAALIAAIVLSLASAIFSIAQKQVNLASLSQQSQYAFYAADTGSECALYWDIRWNYFASTTPSGVNPKCDGSVVTIPGAPFLNQTYNPPSYGYTETFQLSLANGYCANVSIIKCQGALLANGTCCPDGISGTGCGGTTPLSTISTLVKSDGFNAPCSGISTNQSVLQRSVELSY
jgi:hypothetical protein